MKSSIQVAQNSEYAGEDWWKWQIWIEGSPAELDQIKKVVYVLHKTFKNPVQEKTNREQNFRLKSSGWGTFTIYIRIHFHDKNRQTLHLEHELELEYPNGDQCVV